MKILGLTSVIDFLGSITFVHGFETVVTAEEQGRKGNLDCKFELTQHV